MPLHHSIDPSSESTSRRSTWRPEPVAAETHSGRRIGNALLLAGAALWANLSWSAALDDPTASAEGRFLGLGAAIAIAAAAWCDARVAAAMAFATTAAIWMIPPIPQRGAAVTLALLVGLAWALARGSGPTRAGERPPWVALAPAVAIGLQPLLRPDLLLLPSLDLRSVVSLAVLPALAGLAVRPLARRFGASAGFAFVATALLAPGWNVTVTAVWVLLAAGAWWNLEGPTSGAVRKQATRWQAAAGLAGSLALLAWLWASGWRIPTDSAPPTALVSLDLPTATRFGLLALVALPGALATRRPRLALAGLALTAVGAVLGSGLEATTAGCALVALATPTHGVLGRLGRTWLAAIAIPTVLLAAYPWAWADPLIRWTELGRLSTGLVFTVGIACVPLLAAVAARVSIPRPAVRPDGDRPVDGRPPNEPLPLDPLPLLWVALTALPLLAMPAPGLSMLGAGPLILNQTAPEVLVELHGLQAGRWVLDTSLVHAGAAATGLPAARVELLDATGQTLDAASLMVGDATAEWAAARSDLQNHPGFRAPPAWLRQVAPDGSFFASRFRHIVELSTSADAHSLRLTRAEELPAGAEVVVHSLESRP